jgi:hypothetical protein
MLSAGFAPCFPLTRIEDDMPFYRVCLSDGSIKNVQSSSIPTILKHFAFRVRWIADLDSEEFVWSANV